MKKVLIAVASRHASTYEIAVAIARHLRTAGLEADVNWLDGPTNGESLSPNQYDAVVIGSGVYMGRWLRPAVSYLREHADELEEKPVWLFSSGPVGESPMPEGQPLGVTDLAHLVAARDHRIFVGKLDRSRLSVAERVAVTLVRSPGGDYRDWNDIAEWSAHMAAELVEPAPVPAAP